MATRQLMQNRLKLGPELTQVLEESQSARERWDRMTPGQKRRLREDVLAVRSSDARMRRAARAFREHDDLRTGASLHSAVCGRRHWTMAMAARYLISIVVVLITACTDASTPAVREAPDVVDTMSATTPPVDTTETVLALDGEGLRIVAGGSGATRPLPFGTPMQETVSAITQVLGSDPRESGESADCGTQFVTWPAGLTTWFTRDRFTGWAVGRGSTLTTISGIGVGSTRVELLDVYAADIRATSLGQEFVAGGIAGILESESDEARITNLWAGTACLAR